jgi:thymidylate synthase (FAD)
MKVKLLSYTKNPEQVVAAAIRQCYSALGPGELKKKIDKETKERLIKQVIASGHTSTLEHASFSFGIEGISRITEVQLVRHRMASYSVQSGRYVKRGAVKYTIPPKILENKTVLKKYKKYLTEANNFYNELIDGGIAVEDARYCQPQSLQTKLVVTMNARALLHFLELRCCERAQWEIRAMAVEMLKQVKKVAPIIFENAGPSCVSQKICWEGERSCGKWQKIKGAELRRRG